jgi:hydrogenase maturation protease
MVDKIARAVLYEGYILYPYRPSVKNRQRWTFGGIYPRAYSEAHPGGADRCVMQTQCLIAADAPRITIKLRFLHLMDRAIEQGPTFNRVQSLRVGDREFQSWQEAAERGVELADISLDDLTRKSQQREFSFPFSSNVEMLRDGDQTVGRLVREQQAIQGRIELSAKKVAGNLIQLNVLVQNHTPLESSQDREQALMRSFASSHLILVVRDGEFISLTDPPPALRDAANQCENIGCWPVLVGENNQTDTLLASPIILPDYPQIAPESPGDLFDGCEIDEILTLRIMTLTDEEKQQAAAVDDRVRAMLARTETLARDQQANLHGTVRGLQPVNTEGQHA